MQASPYEIGAKATAIVPEENRLRARANQTTERRKSLGSKMNAPSQGSDSAGSNSASNSSGAAKSSDGYSNPSETNVATGRQQLNTSLRSIVMSRSVFTLFHGFNPVKDSVFSIGDLLEVDTSSAPERPDFTASNGEEDEEDKLLLHCLQKSKKEVKITKEMGKELHGVCDKKFEKVKLTTIVEAVVPPNEETKTKKKPPRLDIAHGEREGGSLVGFVEVGVTPEDTAKDSEPQKIDQLFWKKVDQAVKYLNLLAENGVEAEDVDGEPFNLSVDTKRTLVLCVIVTNRKRDFGRIAIFACEPKGDGTWRMALMWRRECLSEELSRAFGLYIRSIQFMAEKGFDLELKGEKWTYFGPNCSRVTVEDSNREVCERGCSELATSW